ncbi:hypothetical protein PUH89_06550 [Rhodobacter capsulatus]|uniref:Uncharacterized protein n=1 Tax=Rhodobacter capsulatus TaxID=1061 RepID=A0A1G7LPX2_RHOCA|nr:hypothetical protein [Rhodobacter capsulatus]WER10631.1 hypothetical protein PUH89_06550 [Rhodobacter capsulatus]SDF51424.1 hypothetical protein SAMN04244550_02364 [Rhodobacter capsulatus]
MTETGPSRGTTRSITNIRHSLFQILSGQIPAGDDIRLSDGGEHPFTAIVLDTDFTERLNTGQIMADTDTVFLGEFLERQDFVGNTLTKAVFLTGATTLRDEP